MRSFSARVLGVCGRPIDTLLALVAFPCALLLLAYRRAGSGMLPTTTRMLRRVGVFPIRNHYYEPLFDMTLLRQPLSQDRVLPGIDLDPAGQLAFLAEFAYSAELESMDLANPANSDISFSMQNEFFTSGDAEYLYQFARVVRPQTIIEIGSGNSTKILHAAILKNNSESNTPCRHQCIEPYEMGWLERMEGIEVVRKRLEDCDIDWYTALQSGDLLFIDSSHMIRPQGDVLKEYLEIIPQLSPGVYVHIHDIFTPKDYPDVWVKQEMRFWNEQYLLEALLQNSNCYKVLGALNYLKHHHYAALREACPYLTPDREPGSFYFRVR